MMENTWYSVISPEGCAAILWRDSTKASQAAEAMKVSAADLLEMGVVDKVVKEPVGGAHQDFDEAARIVKQEIQTELQQLAQIAPPDLIEARLEKYAKMGFYNE